LLEIRRLSKSYTGPRGQVRALEEVSLHVAAGEFVAVQGPSGCGKTTLLLAAGGLLRPDQGQIIVDGHDLYALGDEERARLRAATIGFVFQQFHLVPYLSVLDNVLTPTLALPAADGRARAEQLANGFGLGHRLHHVPAELSTGERQRTALARALLNRPKVILADEPTGNLDEANGRLVLGYLADFAREGGAVLLATHDPRAAEYAQRVVPLGAGQAASIPAGGGS
jgi:ABC-type lipoprotein export system ATPase subunit